MSDSSSSDGFITVELVVVSALEGGREGGKEGGRERRRERERVRVLPPSPDECG